MLLHPKATRNLCENNGQYRRESKESSSPLPVNDADFLRFEQEYNEGR